MAESRPDFQARQFAFAAHIRDPDHAPPPADVEDRRMAVYRELFYNNIDSFLADTLPVLRRLLDDDHWHALVRDFFVRHRCHSPYFLDIPREFLRYLDEVRGERPEDPPFLRELAHYEWIELALSVAEAAPLPADLDPAGDLLTGIPVVSPLAWPLAYRYPVHRIGPDYRPEAPPDTPTWLVVYRDHEDAVHFLHLNAVSARLLDLLANGLEESGQHIELTGISALERVAGELQHPDPGQVVEAGRSQLEDWRERGVLCGARAPI